MPTTQTRLGTILRLWRTVNGLTTAQVGQEIGVSASTISRIENGGKMDMDSFVKLLSWFMKVEGRADG